MFDDPNSTQIQRLFYMHDYPEIAYIFSLATILRCLSTEKIYIHVVRYLVFILDNRFK